MALGGSAIPDLEYTGLEMLAGFRRELARRNVELWFAELNEGPRAMVTARALDVRLFCDDRGGDWRLRRRGR